ncbi:hypothetical protein E4U12_003787 [Claviceps purpurea]|nr:hypothetical protein E4U12_003787 [Claviceps purpurea]KAG6310931.1 hypothetical protein E4U44_004879 [Claviceps purpurea]
MQLAERRIFLLPMVLALVAFILAMLALHPSHQPGFMEEYAIVRFDTSMLGRKILNLGHDKKNKRDLLDSVRDWASGKTDDAKNKIDEAKDKIGDKKDEALKKINETKEKIAAKIIEELGIMDWYSFHVMMSCEGNYTPKAPDPQAKAVATNCSSSGPDDRFNLNKLLEPLDKKLKALPFDVKIDKVHVPDSIQEKIDKLNRALLSLTIIYAIGAGLSGLAFLCSILAFWKPDLRCMALINLVVSSPGFLALFIASMVATVAASTGVKAINEVGGIIGLSATHSTQFRALTWVSTGFMGVVTLFWLVSFLKRRRVAKRRIFVEK